MRRRFSYCSAIALIASTVTVVSAGPAWAASTTYSGRGIAFGGTVAGTTVGLGDTLALPSTGGHQTAASNSGGVPNLLGGDTLHASAFGQNDRTRTEAAASGITITTGTETVEADFAMTRAMAVDGSSNTPVLSGSTTISNLVVNGVPTAVTGAANQVVTLPNGTLTINEQITSTSGSTGSITVNAMHLTLTDDTDLVVASSSAGITADSSNCGSNRQPTTGGGWIIGASLGKGTFGVSGRPTSTGFTGHLVYKDHGTGLRISGPVTFYQELGPNTAILQGPATQNGASAGTFTVEVQDNGEPGSSDTFSIQTESIPPHSAGGTLQGGNIQIHKPCK